MEQNLSWEANSHPATQDNTLPSIYLLQYLQDPTTWTYPGLQDPFHTLPLEFERYILILSTHLRLSSE